MILPKLLNVNVENAGESYKLFHKTKKIMM